jgi:outer membrane lipoprotein-sorting protein
MGKSRILIIIIVAVFCLCSQPLLRAQEAEPDIDTIIKKVDELYRSNTSYGEMEMTIMTPNWERTLKMEFWSEGMDKTFIYIESPKKDRGIATLRIEKEMWNYFPKINKVMKVPPSMMMGSWMGSDFTNDDLVKESTLLDDYDRRLIRPAGAEEGYYYIELSARADTISVWDKIEVKVRKSDYIPVRQTYYDEKGNSMRVLNFSDVKNFSGRIIPSTMEMTPTGKEGHKTIVKYINARFDAKLSKDVFTLRNLQKKR